MEKEYPMLPQAERQRLFKAREALWGTPQWQSLDGDAERNDRYSNPRKRSVAAVWDEYQHRLRLPDLARAGAAMHQKKSDDPGA